MLCNWWHFSNVSARSYSLITCWFGSQCDSLRGWQFVELDVFPPVFADRKTRRGRADSAFFSPSRALMKTSVPIKRQIRHPASKAKCIYIKYCVWQVLLMFNIGFQYPPWLIAHWQQHGMSTCQSILNTTCCINREELSVSLIFLQHLTRGGFAMERLLWRTAEALRSD